MHSIQQKGFIKIDSNLEHVPDNGVTYIHTSTRESILKSIIKKAFLQSPITSSMSAFPQIQLGTIGMKCDETLKHKT